MGRDDTFHLLSFTGRSKYEGKDFVCHTLRFLFLLTSVSATLVGLAKKDLLLELLDLLLALPSIPPPRYLSAVSTAQSTLHLRCVGRQTIFVCLLTPSTFTTQSEVEVFDTTHAANSIITPCMLDMAVSQERVYLLAIAQS